MLSAPFHLPDFSLSFFLFLWADEQTHVHSLKHASTEKQGLFPHLGNPEILPKMSCDSTTKNKEK
jgi:hypothetical protein